MTQRKRKSGPEGDERGAGTAHGGFFWFGARNRRRRFGVCMGCTEEVVTLTLDGTPSDVHQYRSTNIMQKSTSLTMPMHMTCSKSSLSVELVSSRVHGTAHGFNQLGNKKRWFVHVQREVS